MNQQLRPRAKWIAWMCMIVYFASYIMRINFTVLLVKVCSDMQVEKNSTGGGGHRPYRHL